MRNILIPWVEKIIIEEINVNYKEGEKNFYDPSYNLTSYAIFSNYQDLIGVEFFWVVLQV